MLSNQSLRKIRKKAVVQSGVIQLQTPELSSGTKVEVVVSVEPHNPAAPSTAPKSITPKEVARRLEGLPAEEIEAQLKLMLGTWEDEEEIEQIFDDIDRARHLDFGRDIPPLEE